MARPTHARKQVREVPARVPDAGARPVRAVPDLPPAPPGVRPLPADPDQLSGPIDLRPAGQRATSERARATWKEASAPHSSNPVVWLVQGVADVARKCDRDRLFGLAGETAFFVVLTLFPALLFAVAVLGQLDRFVGSDAKAEVQKQVVQALSKVLTTKADGALDTVRDLFTNGAGFLTLASLLALVSLSTAFATVINTVTIASDVPETRGWWRRRFLGLVIGVGSVVTGTVLVTAIVVGPLVGTGNLPAAYRGLWDYARWPVAAVAVVLWVMTLFHFCPARRRRWREQLPGAMITAALWLTATSGLSVYLGIAVPKSPLLGALGGGLILMTWVYLLSAALLIGAEVNTILSTRRDVRARRGELTAREHRRVQET